MKNILLITVFAVLLAGFMSPALYGQQFYLGFDGGYGLKINSPSNTWNTDNLDENGSNVTCENISYSLGQGVQAGISAGYMFNENLGVEVGIAYQNGAHFKSHFFVSDSSTSTFTNINYSLSAQSIRISPAMIIQLKPEATFSPFMKMGLVCSMASMDGMREGISSGDYEKIIYVYSKGMNLGVLSSLGAVYHLNDKLALVGEVKIQLLSYTPGKRVISEYSINGIDQLSGLTTSDIEIEYVNSYSDNSNIAQPTTEPEKRLKELYPLSNYGFHIGLRFNL